MTDTEINVAIAEACGWKPTAGDKEKRSAWLDITGQDLGDYCGIPNYCADLNAMHEAETFALKTAGDALAYAQTLLSVLGATADSGDIGLWDVWKTSKASPHDRAEAFLRTLNLWND